MKKTTLIIIAGVVVLLGVIIAIIGNRLVNNNLFGNVNDVANIEEALKDINSSDTSYIDNSYSDITDNLDTIATPVTTKDKDTSLNQINDALSNTDTNGIDESGGYNINFGNL